MGNNWPPDYTKVFNARIKRLQKIKGTGTGQHAWHYYQENPIDFIEHWVMTYDPRNSTSGSNRPTSMPFILFPKQKEMVGFILDCVENQNNGLIEKSRDMGATWVCCALSVWMWLFRTGVSIGWGSRKAILVDRLGDPDSIFEKIRIIIQYLPSFLKPNGLSTVDHMNFMRCINPVNGSTITGESGDNIGRGGRKLLYFKDESAHYEHAASIDSALTDNTNVQIDISSVNGAGNVFYKIRHGGRVPVFIMDWRDHPLKDQAWYDRRKADAEAKGLQADFAKEVDRDYTAAIEDVFIPAAYVRAAIDAHLKIPFEAEGVKRMGFDPYDGGKDKHAAVIVHGGIIQFIKEWTAGDAHDATYKAVEYGFDHGIEELIFDNIGIGASVKSTTITIRQHALEEAKRKGLPDSPYITWLKTVKVVGFNAGVNDFPLKKQMYTKGKRHGDMFLNAKAQAWWLLRDRFYATYKAVNGSIPEDTSALISIPSKMQFANDLITELSLPKSFKTTSGLIKVESKDELKRRGIPSHNLADALVMCYAPVQQRSTVRVMVI